MTDQPTLAVSPPVAPSLNPSKTAPARRLEFIDALRGFACLWVCFCHVEGYWLDSRRPPFHAGIDAITSRVASMGAVGVDIFIVLSGFCLYWPLIQKSGKPDNLSTGRFYLRRAFRLLPPYYFSLIICAILAMQNVPLTVGQPATVRDLIYHVFLLQTLIPHAESAINGSFWSLALELQLYLVFPLLIILVRSAGLRAGLAAGLVSVIATHFIAPLTPVGLFGIIPGRWIQFILGMWAADVVRRANPNSLKAACYASLILFPCGMLSISLNAPELWKVLLWGVIGATSTIALSSIRTTWFTTPWHLGWLTRIGVISYSIYLLQQPFLLLTARLVKPYGLSISGAMGLFLCVGLPVLLLPSWLMYKTVEVPCMALGKSMAKRPPKENAARSNAS